MVKHLISLLTSLKVTVFCLLVLFILTAWGTYYQSDYGLYAAQNRFFHSFFFLVGGFLPIPGAQLILWILSINLISDALINVRRRAKRFGIFLIHWGMIVLLFGSLITYYFAQESYLALYEGDSANVSTDYREWEIAAWEINESGTNNVYAYKVKHIKKQTVVDFKEIDLKFKVLSYYKHARMNDTVANGVSSFSGITSLKALRASYDPAENLPGVVIELKGTPLSSQSTSQSTSTFQSTSSKILLWSQERGFFEIKREGKPSIAIELRRIRYPLPIGVSLNNFSKEEYRGTGIVKNYESIVTVFDNDIERKVRIYMNNPLRHDNFTFYQASYQIDPDGREKTVLAVVENVGRLLPYISSGIVFAGLLIHFVTMLFAFNASRQRQ